MLRDPSDYANSGSFPKNLHVPHFQVHEAIQIVPRICKKPQGFLGGAGSIRLYKSSPGIPKVSSCSQTMQMFPWRPGGCSKDCNKSPGVPMDLQPNL